MNLSVLTLLPSTSVDDPIEAQLTSVPIEALPHFTELRGEDIHDEKDRDGSMLLNGSQIATPHTTESALRKLRLPDHPRYILSERFQTDTQKAWFQFDLKKAPIDQAFWRHTWDCDDLEENFDVMDLFIVIPNRYLDTAKFFTTIDVSPESEEIRLLVLPPSGEQVFRPLGCEFRNVRLDDPLRPGYQTFSVAGPAAPRNGHNPVYKYDIAIKGHLSVSSDGMRTGLQKLQQEFEETFVWNEELCINCRDVVDSEHFHKLRTAIIKGAKSGATLMFDRVSAFTTTLNSNRKFVPPAVDRKTREIRLLQFQGSPRDEAIKLKLVVRNLDDMPVFKALSYVWGDDTGYAMHYTHYQPEDDMSKWPIIKNSTSETVFFEDFKETAESIMVNKIPLMTTKHLANALRCLRDTGKCKYFWVDALCIDQNSWEDRSSQVRMMAEIYAQAQQVIAWLGLGKEADATMELMNTLGQESFDMAQFVQWAEVTGNEEEENQILLNRTEESNVVKETADMPFTTAVLGFSDADLRDESDDAESGMYRILLACLRTRVFINSVEEIVNHPWWHRLWIYQESVIPSSLVLHRGSYSIEFETLWDAYSTILHLSELTPFYSHFPKPMLNSLSLDSSKYRMLASIRLERQRRGHPGSYTSAPIPNDWLFYIQELAQREASDPRDIIYAAMGLATSTPRNIVPDYSKEASEVYINAAKETIKSSDDLTILSMCGGVKESSATWASYLHSKYPEVKKKASPLPSWVPYWGQQSRSGMGAKFVQNVRQSAPNFCAGGTDGAGAKFSKDSRILFAMGVVVDVVGKVVKGYSGKPQGGGKQVSYDGKDFVLTKVPYNSILRCTKWFQAFDAWREAIVALSKSRPMPDYITGGPVTNALQHAFCAPFFNLHQNCCGLCEEGLDKSIDEFRTRYTLEAQKFEPDEFSFHNLKVQAELDQELTNLVGFMTVSTKHELLITEKGYIGVSPPGCSQVGGVQVGDMIVVLRGAAVPLILRPVGNLDRFLLIGDAYVHGIMYGTILEGCKPSDMRKFPII